MKWSMCHRKNKYMFDTSLHSVWSMRLISEISHVFSMQNISNAWMMVIWLLQRIELKSGALSNQGCTLS